MTSKGRVYTPLFSLKESLGENQQRQGIWRKKNRREKRVYKALIKDKSTGAEQEALLKIFINRDQEYKGELESLLKNPSPCCPQLLGFESFPGGGPLDRLFGAPEKKAIVMEYIKGVSLARLTDRFSLSAAEINSLLIAIHKGLKDLRKAGLCHGDLSLDNVLVDWKGQVKLIDFGKGNYQGQARGTPPFTAPELFKGGRASFLTDLFSLGVIEFALKNPERRLSMKTKSPEDFLSSSQPLLSLDPQKRFFPYSGEGKASPSLAEKVRDILSSLEGRQIQTEDLPAETAGIFSGGDFTGHLFRRAFRIALFSAALFLFAGASSAPLPTQSGILKVFTNRWFLISAPGLQSYAPFSAPLPSGKHIIKWKTANHEGEKRIHIERGKTLLLKDQDFLQKP